MKLYQCININSKIAIRKVYQNKTFPTCLIHLSGINQKPISCSHEHTSENTLCMICNDITVPIFAQYDCIVSVGRLLQKEKYMNIYFNTILINTTKNKNYIRKRTLLENNRLKLEQISKYIIRLERKT